MRFVISPFLLFLFGCNSTPPPQDDQPADKPAPVVHREAPSAPQRETWDALFAGPDKIGYIHTVERSVREGGRDLIRYEVDSQMTIKRLGQTVDQKMTFHSIETPDGQVQRFISELNGGMLTTGRVEGDEMRLATKTLGQLQTAVIPWKSEYGGFLAVEKSLERQPLQPGESRTITGLYPNLNQVAETKLEAVDYEETPLLRGSARLLRVNQTVRMGQTNIEAVAWVDEKGETLKMVLPSLNQITYRTTKEIALESQGSGAFDIGKQTLVRLDPPPKAARDSRLVYRVHLKSGNPAKVFPASLSQRVAAVDEHTATITILAVRPDRPEQPDFDVPRPTDDDLAPNNLIQSDDERVRAMAAGVFPDEPDPWTVATALESFVDKKVVSTEFSQALASAAEVARSLQGDCTEHAVLLAALCRARKIPARVVIGLVYVESLGGFAYHMWNEVWIADRWVPLDGTRGQGGIGATYLKIADSNLKGVDAYSTLLPVFQVMGQLEVRVVE